MPFGLSIALAFFQATINQLLRSFFKEFVIVFFFYDILIYSPSLDEHLRYLELVFSALSSEKFYLKFSKCLFAQESVDYLGHIISAQEVSPDKSKIQSILQLPLLTTITHLRGFLALSTIY